MEVHVVDLLARDCAVREKQLCASEPRAIAIRCPISASAAISSAVRSASRGACRRGTTRVCPGAMGAMSRNAMTRPVSATK